MNKINYSCNEILKEEEKSHTKIGEQFYITILNIMILKI